MKARSASLLLLAALASAGAGCRGKIWAQTSDAASEMRSSAAPESTLAMEQRLFQLANQSRKEAGAPPLKWDEHLAIAARLHSNEMARRGGLSHQFPDEPTVSQRLGAQGARFDASAENVAFDDNIDDMHDGWMHSPGHRANLLNPKYDVVGIGVTRVGERFYGTTDFAHSLPTYSAGSADDAVISSIQKIRRQHRLAALTGGSTATLDREACTDRNSADFAGTTPPNGFSGQHQFNFTTGDLTQLPPKLVDEVGSPAARSFALGVCSRSDKAQGFTLWRVLAVVYR